ncbi:MAG TPA: amino acid adenylation domain-containing protein, partial [Caldithrix abyssi]|nr:amino acid adenylation domain-containing protein [Caldithrix abyssi]
DEPEGNLNLPLDFPHTSDASNRGNHLLFTIDRETTAKVVDFCKQRQITPYMFLMAVFSLFLTKITGQEDVRIGSPVANRDKPELKNLIGLFINVVVLRNDVSDNPTFNEFVNRVRGTVLDALSNSVVPIEILINRLFPNRDKSDNPLTQVLFDFQTAPLQKMNFAGLEIESLELETGSIKFDLVLSISLSENEIHGIFGYKTDLFRKETVERFIDWYRNLLSEVLANPDRPIWEIPLLTTEEKRQIIAGWSKGNFFDVPPHPCIHQRFEQQAAQTPDMIALLEPADVRRGNAFRQVTYRELNEQANRLAHYLITQGVGPESIVGLCLERSVELFVGLLAILKAGGAYLPIDPTYPAERIDYIIADSGIDLVLTAANTSHLFKDKVKHRIPLDGDQALWESHPDQNPDIQTDPENLAYLIYTSGSTGKPKAVMVPRRALVNHATAMRDEYDMQVGDRILQYISISFDAAAEEIYPALISGATLVLPPGGAELSGFDLLEIIEKEKINVLHVPVPVWHFFIDFLSEQKKDIPESIRLMMAGGEQPSIPKFHRAAELARRPTKFVNLYGPTETTIASTYFEAQLSPDRTFEYDFIPIGKPIHNDRVYLLDKAMQPVPRGVLGEIYIGGMGVTRGYLNRPDLTAERFLPDPFSDEPGARMYRTGDLGRFNSDGEIIFAGRVDFQVKIRGFRIELGEIESVIEKHPSVKQCVVFAHGQEGQEKKIAAYVVPANGDNYSPDALRDYLVQQLPDYMVPSFFVTLDEIPLTSTGKVDRRALPDPTTQAASGGESEYVAPSSKLEVFLYEMWKEILGIEKIGIHDNFFQLGGSSIQAATFVNRLQDALGEYVYIVAIYDAPTIADLCEYLKRDYPQSVYRITGEKVESYQEKERISQEHVNHLQSIIKTPGPYIHTNGRSKNKPAVFVISSPRSGSTLTRAILGGHPKLFSPPELQLLNFDTLQERKQQLTGRDDFWLDGTIRAIMEIKNCSADEAREIMSEFEEKNLTTQEFYAVMQDWLGDRIFVDKTPNYALSPDILERAEAYFEDALYIHLIRHPYGVIPSFEKAKLHVFYPPFFSSEHPYTPRQLAELIWVVSHRNILNFLRKIPQNRQYRLFYEDLVTQPEKTIQGVCDFLNIDLHPDMLEPQKDSHKRMTDGLNDLSKMLGDVRFHEHKGITADRAYSWKKNLTEDYLGDVTWNLVESFGYEDRSKLEYSLGKIIRPIEPLAEGETPPLSFAQQRLWFLDQLEPDNPFYNMPLTVRVKGDLDLPVLEQALNRIVDRHENLRTAFKTEDGQPKVEILPRLQAKITVIDLSNRPAKNLQKDVERLIRKEAAKPFNLSVAPLFRATLIRLNETEGIFILNMHHIISDGMSLEIFLKEISVFYKALKSGSEPQLPALPLQYGAFAKWQRAWLESAVLQKQLRFWHDQLKGVPALLQLPTDFPRPRVQSYQGSKAFFELPPEVSSRLIEIAARHQTTPYVVLLAAFSVLLHRYSGQNDICIGTPVSGRTRKEIEGLIGFFVNSLPLRFELDGNPSFDELLAEVQQVVQDALSNQDVPFEKIIDTLNLERDTSYTPLFQVMFIYQQSPLQKIALPQLEIEPLQVDTGTSKFDLSLAMVEDNGSFRGMLEYNTSLFKAESMERFIAHFMNLLRDLTANTQKPVRALNLLDAEEAEAIVHGYDRYQVQEPEVNVNVVRLFQEVADKHGDRPALVHRDRRMTYAELNEKANRLAHYLRSIGVGAEDVVGLCIDRSPEMMVGLLAILKAGAAYLPIDPAYPEERIEYIIEDSAVKLVVAEEAQRQRFASRGVEVICPTDEQHPFNDQPATNPDVPIDPNQLAYLIYTSGSTGRPKAVMVPHRGLLNHALSMNHEYNIGPKDRVLQYISISFDASAEEIYPALLGGATLILPVKAAEMSASDLYQIIQQEQITVLHIPVPVWHFFIDYLSEQNLTAPPTLRLMMAGGEQPSIQKFHRAAELSGQKITFVNLYGPTETTIASTYYKTELSKDKTFEYDVIPIGHPLSNDRVYILDQELNPVPRGVVGEIYIAGVGVTRGYLNRPELTAERFIPDPYSPQPGGRMYRTGDLGRFNSQGDIIFAGRSDFQVKIRGFRIELGEIESALTKHPGVKDALVMARKQDHSTQLVAYVIPKKDAQLTVSELRTFLGQSLPDYMVPAYFVSLERFPITPTGKLDRKRLPEPEISRAGLDEEFIAPRNEKEQIIADIWQELLKMPKVGVKDNFFELGGDSILSIQVIARANQKGLKLTPKQLFEYPTIEGLAAVAEEGVAIHAEQGMVSGEFPLIPIQRWFFDLKLNKPQHWNQSLTIRLNEALDAELLSKAVEKILQHHDLLRATFPAASENGQGKIPETSPVNPFYLHDLTNLSKDALQEKLRELALEAQSSFDLNS